MMESLNRSTLVRNTQDNISGFARVSIHIINVQWPDISKLLDIGSALLALSIGQIQVQLLNTALDCVPSGQPGREVDVSGETKVGWVDNLVGAWVGKDGLGVNTSLVGKGAETSDVVVEGDVDLNGLSDEVLKVTKLVELVFAHNVVTVGNDHASHQSTERGDTVTLTNTEDGGVNVGSTSLKSTVGVGNSTSSIVVEVSLDITRDNTTESSDEVVDLAGRSTSNSVGNTLSFPV